MASTSLANTTTVRQRKPKASSRPGAPRGRRAKGEKTRRKILTATFKVIARDGIRMVNHRAVAAEAEVQLSLTTYYFKDIDAMIKEAFQQFMERMRPDLDVLWADIFNYLEGFTAQQLRLVSVREAVCERLATAAAQYIIAQYTQRPDGLAVEQIFFTEARLSAPLRKLGMTHRQQLLVPMVRLCAYFNRVDPELDAELLLDTITALEYQGLALPRNAASRARVHDLVKRQLGWVLGLKRA
jgi:DNA-binding transcriptional regulator YbjK